MKERGVARSGCDGDKTVAEGLFQGIGETAQFARELDWSQTALGAVETWPVSLRTAAGMVMPAGFPTVLLWGPRLVQIYNDGYRPILGNKHPAGMGQPTKDCWPETWNINEPLFERVRRGETLTFHNLLHTLSRHGDAEDAYFTLCCSPVRDEECEVAGILVTLFETTEQVNAAAKRRKAEEERGTSEDRLALALEAGGGVGAWNWEIPSNRFYCSARFAELFSVDPALAAVGAPMEVFVNGIHPDDREEVLRRVRRAVETGEDYLAEHRLLRADGTVRWIGARGRRYRDEAGVAQRFPGVVFDITELKLAEIERRRSAGQLQTVIDNVPGLVSYVDRDVRYRFANGQYRDWFDCGALNGGRVVDVVGEKAFATAWPYLEKALGGEPVHFEQFLEYDKARPRWVQVAYAPDRDEAGEVCGVVAMVQDVTVKRQMEEAVRASEERLRQSLAQAPMAVAVLRGPSLVFELTNALYREFFPDRELVGRPLAEAVPEVTAELLVALHSVLETGLPFAAMEYLLPVDRDRDGVREDYWFTFSYQPLRELDGTVTGIIVVANDVTSHVRTREDLKRANRELEEFAYVASHDIQEPLRMVSIYSQLLVNRLGANDEVSQTQAGFIRQGVERMQRLIRDLLEYSRAVQRDERTVGTAELSISLAEATAVLRGRMDESGATLSAGTLPRVRGETSQLTHVFQNLISNSLKYRKEDTPPEISISSERKGDMWTVSFKDNGIGFDQKYAERIFGLFKRLHKDDYPGTGLGLAICQRIVDRYGGRMWAEGRPGAGSTFYFCLPAVEEP